MKNATIFCLLLTNIFVIYGANEKKPVEVRGKDGLVILLPEEYASMSTFLVTEMHEQGRYPDHYKDKYEAYGQYDEKQLKLLEFLLRSSYEATVGESLDFENRYNEVKSEFFRDEWERNKDLVKKIAEEFGITYVLREIEEISRVMLEPAK